MKRYIYIMFACVCAMLFASVPAQAQQNVEFVPYVGIDNEALGGNGLQQVHQKEQTIYYQPGEEIVLRLQEDYFFGYMRWYNYNTGKAVTFSTAPKGSNGNFLNTTTGWYALASTRNNTTAPYVLASGGNWWTPTDGNEPPVWTGGTDGGSYSIACDVSAYVDYKVTTESGTITAIQEPTLSYRQVYHLKPASEMAERFKALKEGEYLENRRYTAPANTTTNILLTTDYRYRSFRDKSELCYFYYTNGVDGTLGLVGDGVTAKWRYRQGTTGNFTELTNPTYPSFDYLQVSGAAGTTYTYQLYVPGVHGGKDLLIAQFVVDFLDKNTCGPLTSDKPIVSKATIEAEFEVLEYNDFSFGAPAPGTSSTTYLDKHLPWGESTYGFVYPRTKMDDANINRLNSSYFPFYGEYFLFNYQTSNDWADGANHAETAAGATMGDSDAGKLGYVMYVDGTQEPGLVASITTREKVRICEKQKMYCSVWLRNTNKKDGTPPIFRCNVQGRNTGDSEWTDVSVFFVGALPEEGWRQVVFPVVAEESYDETRVSIYNFANNNKGNDFMIDDITLYRDKLPMNTFQVEASSVGTDADLPFTMAVLRVDYADRSSAAYLFYQIYDLKDNGTKEVVTLSDYLGISGNSTYGRVEVPDKTYIPQSETIYENVNAFYTNVYSPNPTTGKCFVKDGDKYVMYVVHAIPKTPATSGPYPYVKTNYGVRMSYAGSEDLGKVDDCSMDMLFTVTQETTFELRNAIGTGETKEFLVNSDDNCANTLYVLDIKITQDMEPEKAGGEEEGMPYADWLKGIASDEVFADATQVNNTDADAKFLAHYGYSRDAVRAAIEDLRSNNETADETDLKITDFTSETNYNIVVDLCQKGYLELYTQTVTFYLGAADTARYWVFPIEGTAKSGDLVLRDTPEPKWVQVSSYDSQFSLRIFGYELPDQYSTSLPIVRVLKSKMNEEIVIEYEDKSFTAGTTQQGDAYLFSTTDLQLSRALGTQIFQYTSTVDNTNHIITLQVPEGNTHTFNVGEEYVVAVMLRNSSGEDVPSTGNNGCPVGTWFFNILVIPDVVVWTGGEDAVWCDDANWKGYDANEADQHYAPIEGSGVVIPSDKAPKLTELAIENAGVTQLLGNHPCPLHLNFPLTPECGQIYFEPGATMENQHLLKHDRAFVDLVVPQGTWNSVAVPIAGVVSGDMFIPHKTTGEYQGESTESTEPFGVTGFNPEGSRLSTSAYAFWQSFFNKTVYMLNENGSKESAISTTTTEFAPTNSMEVALEVGAGHQLLGFGPDPNEENLTIRLPKPDTEYSYYHPNGAAATPTQINRGENAGKLIYHPDQAIALTGETSETQYVMFGNPTMAYIDMQKFLTANEAILQGAYYLMKNDSWEAATALVQATETDGYLAPMRSVMLELNNSATRTGATVTLKPEHLVASLPTAPAAAPRRAANINDVQKMVIRADVDGTQAQCIVAANKVANDSYTLSEDALFFSSGVESGVSDVVATSPVNMYTLSERVPMMVDVRKNIDTIPLAMLVMESYQTEMMTLTFDLSADWDKDVYFCDSKTGAKTLIFDGMEIEVELSANHEVRYFLEGPDKFEPGNDIWSSTENVKGEINVWAYSPDNGQLVVTSNDILKSVEVYDLSGRLVADKELELQYNSTSLSIPTGAYIIKAALRDNSVHTLSSLVK